MCSFDRNIGLLPLVSIVSQNTLVVFSGLVPRPVDFPSSRMHCENYSRAYHLSAQDLCKKRGWNCASVSVFNEFLDKWGRILEPNIEFQDGLYLTVTGIRRLRSAWLRHLGYFPKKWLWYYIAWWRSIAVLRLFLGGSNVFKLELWNYVSISSSNNACWWCEITLIETILCNTQFCTFLNCVKYVILLNWINAKWTIKWPLCNYDVMESPRGIPLRVIA